MGVQRSVRGLYLAPELLSPGSTEPPQTIISLPVQTAIGPWTAARGVGASITDMGRQLSVRGWYRAPSAKRVTPARPPHTIISSPVQMAAGFARGLGAPSRETGRH